MKKLFCLSRILRNLVRRYKMAEKNNEKTFIIESKIKNFKSRFKKKCENPQCNNIIITPNPIQKYCPECTEYRNKIIKEKREVHRKENPYGTSEKTKQRRLNIILKTNLRYSFNHVFCKYYTYERQVEQRIKNIYNTKLGKSLIDKGEFFERDVLITIDNDIKNKKKILNALLKKIKKKIDKICV